MPVKIGHQTYYWWSRKETAQHNTERHRVFQKQLYLNFEGNTRLSHEEWEAKLKAFKEKNFDLLDSEKMSSKESIGDPTPFSALNTDSKLNNKLEG